MCNVSAMFTVGREVAMHAFAVDVVMRLDNPQVCGYPEAKQGINTKKWVIAHNTRVGVVYLAISAFATHSSGQILNAQAYTPCRKLMLKRGVGAKYVVGP